MKHNYEEHKQKRIDNAKNQIEKNKKQSAAFFKKADDIIACIPPGQPILIGHHSEKKHRSALNQFDNAMHKGFEASNKTEYYESRVKAMEDNESISSDDPNAIEKLEGKLDALESMQQFMKDANKYIKKKDKEKFLALDYGTEKLWDELNMPHRFQGTGYPRYSLTNNNANINRIRKRIAYLKQEAKRIPTDTMIKGIRVLENTYVGRLQLIFPDKPSYEIRQQLKRKWGFRWSHDEQAWQRQLNNNAVYAATEFLKAYQPPAIPINTAASDTQSESAA
jgi:hypothetical protein